MLWHWLLHYTGSDNVSGPWYGFWSGFGSDIQEFGILALVFGAVRHHNCHVKGCKSFCTAVDPEHGWRACKRHHSRAHLIGDARS